MEIDPMSGGPNTPSEGHADQPRLEPDEIRTRAEILERLAKTASERYQSRRNIEWKLCFGIWTAFGAAAGFFANLSHPVSLWLAIPLSTIAILVVVVHALYWAPWIQGAHRSDSFQRYWWTSAIEELIDMRVPPELRPKEPPEMTAWPRYRYVPKDEAETQPEHLPPFEKWKRDMRHPNAKAQLCITGLFALLFVLAVLTRVGKNEGAGSSHTSDMKLEISGPTIIKIESATKVQPKGD